MYFFIRFQRLLSVCVVDLELQWGIIVSAIIIAIRIRDGNHDIGFQINLAYFSGFTGFGVAWQGVERYLRNLNHSIYQEGKIL